MPGAGRGATGLDAAGTRSGPDLRGARGRGAGREALAELVEHGAVDEDARRTVVPLAGARERAHREIVGGALEIGVGKHDGGPLSAALEQGGDLGPVGDGAPDGLRRGVGASEEQRVDALMGEIARAHGKELVEWSATRGLQHSAMQHDI
jgi:hypothetical protein